jgi:1-acyl-sn-glycerol-3-phosphate acyltransferase
MAVSVAARIGAWSRRAAARALLARRVDLQIQGLEHVPTQGPVILVARHYHHLYDACAIVASLPREVHIMVALDWLDGVPGEMLQVLARSARWPGVWRAESRAHRLNRSAYRLALDLLREGRVLLVFPEGYPVVDPRRSRPHPAEVLLPFDAGFLTLAERADPGVMIVPVGLGYVQRRRRTQAWLRFGQPMHIAGGSPREVRARRLAEVEGEVRALCVPPSG